jgi:uncharacterized protein (DUF3820 family)
MSDLELGFSKKHMLKLAQWEMPFGKYQGKRLIDLPEEYLFWFQKQGFPNGELGELMALSLELKIAGVDGLIKRIPAKQDEKSGN